MKIMVTQQRQKASTLPRQLLRLALLFLVNVCFITLSFAQTTIRGKVTDADGKGIVASVTVRGTTTGATTNENGDFTINAPANATLVISSVGYAVREIEVNSRTTINVSLVLEGKELENVVVVGYGAIRKEAVTGSVTSIAGDKMREVPSPNISQSLQGRLPGVEISQTSTRPGATMQIRIRGIRSLSADNNPLIVLDGIPFMGSLADINPNDIKSIDVLKDASATAVYGSRGANGVILLTTDKGVRNRKARVSYNTYTGAQKVFAKYPMMNGPQFVALRAAGTYPGSTANYANGADEANDLNTDWQDLFYQTGIVTDHNISLSNGTETGNYNFGLGYYLNQGVIPTQDYKRYSLRGAIDQGVGKYFRFGFTTYNKYDIATGNQVGLYNTLSMTPISNPFNPDGTTKRSIRMILDNQYVYTNDIIEKLEDNSQWLNETRGFASYNSIYGEVRIPWVTGLKFRTNLGLDFLQTNNGAYTAAGVGDGLNPNTPSTASVDNRHTYHWTWENMLTYDRTFGKHTVNAVALYSAEQSKYNRSNMNATDVPADAFQFYNIGQAAGQIIVNPANQDYQLWGLLSGMGRVMYTYDGKYMITATVRTDGSSRLAEGKKWHTYPAVSVGWNIADESFMDNVGFINSLKLRAGYGETSNQAIAPYATLGRLDTRPYNFGTNYATGYQVSQLPNDALGWEFSKTINIGLDFSLFKNRLSGSIDYYKTKTEDVLLPLSLPQTSGATSYNANIGSTENKGIEIALQGTILEKNGWTWEAGVNFFVNNNKLLALASGQPRDEGNWWFPGYNVNAIFDYQKIGLWNSSKDSTDGYMNVLQPGGRVGMIRVAYFGTYDATGRPTRAIGPDDRMPMNVEPDFQGGFNTRVSFKGFDLGVVGFFRKGGILFSTIHGSAGYLNLLSGRRNNIDVDYWRPDNPNAKYPRPGGPVSNDNPLYGTTLSYFDGSFLKIRTITLGYDFNRSLIKNPNMRLRAYFTAQNPFVLFSPFHKESGLDPETNSVGNQNVSSTGAISPNNNQALLQRLLIVGYNTPATRNYIFGLNLTF